MCYISKDKDGFLWDIFRTCIMSNMSVTVLNTSSLYVTNLIHREYKLKYNIYYPLYKQIVDQYKHRRKKSRAKSEKIHVNETDKILNAS